MLTTYHTYSYLYPHLPYLPSSFFTLENMIRLFDLIFVKPLA